MDQPAESYPVNFSVDYPEQPLEKFSTFFRIIAVIPIFIIWALVSSVELQFGSSQSFTFLTAGGALIFPPLLMILFRQKYPRWWFDWNVALIKFQYRVFSYFLLLRDEYPSTDEDQAVHVEVAYPDVTQDLNRWLPLFKWLLAIPHYVVLPFLWVAVFVVVIIVWFVILITGRYPDGLFAFVVGVERWSLRVTAYAFLMVTDRYPPFRLQA